MAHGSRLWDLRSCCYGLAAGSSMRAQVFERGSLMPRSVALLYTARKDGAEMAGCRGTGPCSEEELDEPDAPRDVLRRLMSSARSPAARPRPRVRPYPWAAATGACTGPV